MTNLAYLLESEPENAFIVFDDGGTELLIDPRTKG